MLHLGLGGVDLPIAFDPAERGRCPALWLDGIPTGFRLHRAGARR